MKKTQYIKPDTTIVAVATQAFMAGSLGNGETPNDYNPTDTPTTEDDSDNLSRRRSLWDDNEW